MRRSEGNIKRGKEKVKWGGKSFFHLIYLTTVYIMYLDTYTI